MNKEKSNVKIKCIYGKSKETNTYIVLLDNNEVWSLANIPDEFSEYLGTLGIDIKSIKDVDDREKKMPLKKISTRIKGWLKSYNKIIDDDNDEN
jgi:hypothetical protein